ncbi:MAG TPA: taurine ABC transporter substrate-binding protein [Rhizobiales bacterium]|nr:taurine-binding periplasmic protein precursor [bacterium BMS3Bbin10]HDO52485.1 taurine ABC transporter substrate-binding protein [Hyphomicrobiales bacterium]
MRKIFAALTGAVFALSLGAMSVQAQEVTIGYQQIYNPWKVAIADGAFEKATGYKIKWKKFNSGAKVITAMASGDVHIALAGSSPIAAGISRALPIKLFWITENINDAEALVARNGSGVKTIQDLVGKKVGVPFVSTTHFHMLFALEHNKIDPKSVKLLNMQPNAIAAAWERGDIDAAFVWDPALGRIKKTGKVLLTSGDLAKLGKATFDGMVVYNDFAAKNAKFMCQFVKTIAAADAAYRDDPGSFSGDSANAKKIVKLVGGDAKDVPGVLALYDFPTLKQQVSSTWLGGGKDGGAAKALFFTSEFLKKQRKIDAMLPDYGAVVDVSYAKAALAGGC